MVQVDKNKCIGCGICTGICPDGFQLIDGKSTVKNPNADCIRQAAESCPTGAIIVDSTAEPHNPAKPQVNSTPESAEYAVKSNPVTGIVSRISAGISRFIHRTQLRQGGWNQNAVNRGPGSGNGIGRGTGRGTGRDQGMGRGMGRGMQRGHNRKYGRHGRW